MPATRMTRSTNRRIRRIRFLCVLFVAVPSFVLVGCGDYAPVRSSPDELLPGASAQDWTTFADHLVTANAVGTKRGPREWTAPGEWAVGREVSLAVDEVLWSRKGAPPAPEMLSWQNGGWSIEDGEITEIRVAYGPRMTVRHEYLSPVVYAKNEWGPLTSSGLLEYDEQQINNGPGGGGWTESIWVDKFDGENADALVEVLERTPPAPEVKGLMDSRVMDRLEATQRP